MSREIIHDDDEPILKLNAQGEDEEADIVLEGGTTEVKVINKLEAPLEETPFKVLVELEGVGADERLGVDLVTILDISASMNKKNKLLKMKLAMQFLVQKLSGNDRLSVVSFNRHAKKECPLRQITETSQPEIIDIINDLVARATTNTEAGLRLALKILNDRTRTRNRSAAIMLMTDGLEDEDRSDVSKVPVSGVPVYTFAFGDECDHEVLSAVAKKSKGGTFTAVPNLEDLSVAFSTSLAGLLNVCIEDLTLTAVPLSKSQLEKVNAGNYPQTKGTIMEPVTVNFSSLYNRETRKVLANLKLPMVDNRLGATIFNVQIKYRVNGKVEFDSDERLVNVTRIANPKDGERAEVLAELTRLGTASSITDARILAEKRKIVEAKAELVAAKKSLPEIDAILRDQLDHLILLMASQETYDSKGKVFALALEASHASQRSVALPDGIQTGYETPITKEFQKQAAEFIRNPETYVIPTPEDDKKATTVEVEKATVDLAQSLAAKIKNIESQAATGKVDRIKIEEIAALTRMLAEKLQELEAQ